jgi:predicted TIM-barrel fold metal-dependent hydrolase
MGSFAQGFAFAAAFVATSAVAVTLAAAQTGSSRTAMLKRSATPYIDAHVHIDQNDPDNAVALLIEAMDHLNGARAFIQTEPYGPANPARWDIEKVMGAVKKHPGRVIVMGGGGTLNPMILQAYRTGKADPEMRKKFRERAQEILAEGAAGFGELSIEHFATPASPVKEYEYAPADSPLMLELADIAAEHDVPIDLHMEAIPSEMARPITLKPPNPPSLHANFAAFERFLAYNPRARVVWAHLGADNTGYRTPELMRPLLERHPNLYMEIKYDPGAPGKNPPIVKGKLQPKWLQLFEEFPDRFVIGSDQHYDPTSHAPLARAEANALLLSQLPPDLREKIAIDNPMRVYAQK